jgi:hypothetical protein
MSAHSALIVLPAFPCLVVLARASGGGSAWLTQLPMALGLGVGLSSIVWWALLPFSALLGERKLSADIVIWTVATLLAFRTRQAPAAGRVRDETSMPRLVAWASLVGFVCMSAFAITGVTAFSYVAPHGTWDAWAIWNMRARFLFRGQPLLWQEAFSPELAYSHLDYPLLLPLSVSRAWTFLGSDTPMAPVLLAALFAAATVAVAGISVARARTPAHGLIAAIAVLACPAFLEWAPSQVADIPLGFYMLATFVMMWHATTSDASRLWWVLAGVSAGLAAWTKNEGAVFLVVFMAISAVWVLRKYRWAGLRYLALLCAGAAVGGAALVMFKWRLAPPNGIVSTLDLATVIARADFDRLRFVVEAVGRELWLGGASIVGVLPIVVAFAAIVGIRRRGVAPAVAVVTVVLQVAIYVMVYVLTPYDLRWHVNTSVDRLMVQVLPSAVWGLMLLTR